jgi:hypothetical protein
MSDQSDSELEEALRRTLRPVEPPAGFADRVISAIEADSRSHGGEPAATERSLRGPMRGRALSRARRSTRILRAWPLAAAAAAAVAVIIGGALSYHVRIQQADAERTRMQALEALRIAHDKLDTAFRLVEYETAETPSDPAQRGQIN